MTLIVWCLFIEKNNKLNGSPFKVSVSPEADICDFREEVKKKLRLDHVDAATLSVFRCKNPELSALMRKDELQQKLSTFYPYNKDKVVEQTSAQQVSAIGLADYEVLLVQALNDISRREHKGEDTISAMFQRYQAVVNTSGTTPSEGAKSTNYISVQSNPPETIYDGRAGVNTSPPIAPPIHIYDPVFDKFKTLVEKPSQPSTIDDRNNIRDLMYVMSIIYESENDYSAAIEPVIERLLGHTLRAATHDNNSLQTDATLVVDEFDVVLAEWKASLGSGGDPTTEAGILMRHYLRGHSRKLVRSKCCCPTFLLAAPGSWICIMGGVFTDRPIVQRLTDLKWAALSSTEEDQRVEDLARIFFALRTCVAELRQYYLDLRRADIPPLLPNRSHPRFFPYPRFYKDENGRSIEFNYQRPLEDSRPCVTFLAETVNELQPSEKIVVKFVSRYGHAVHRYLASRDLAPRLRYYGPLLHTRAPGMCSNQMVVMDYLESKPQAPADAKDQIAKILIELHSAGYVFGDLRLPNLLFREDKVQLIDFNWCGQYDIGEEPVGIPQQFKDQIEQALQKLRKEPQQAPKHYGRYPGSISQVEGMWAKGVGPEKCILPGHDWEMLEKMYIEL